MFSLQDFPVGSYFYWVRRLSPEHNVVVYSRFKITEHDKDGNLLSDAAPENLSINGPTQELIDFKAKHPEGFTIVHSRDKYLNYNSNSMIVPEVIFDIHHFPDQVPKTPLNELHKLFGTGLGEVDKLVKEASISFEEWNHDKKLKTVIKMKNITPPPTTKPSGGK